MRKVIDHNMIKNIFTRKTADIINIYGSNSAAGYRTNYKKIALESMKSLFP